jgi:hypothetical protein
MRRLLTLAAFLLIFSLVPVCAQRGGGHGGFSGGHSGFSGGGHAGVSGHSLGGSHFVSHAGSQFGGARGYLGGSRSYGGVRFRGERFGLRNRFGYGYPYYPYYGFYDPWWDSGSSSDEDQASQRQMASEMNEENLEEQQMLGEQDQDAYARPMPRPRSAQPVSDPHARNDPATVLVFRNGQQREIQNYAIVDGLLWNFTPARTEKIPLAVLDIQATIKANDDRGVDFRLPSSGEGQ